MFNEIKPDFYLDLQENAFNLISFNKNLFPEYNSFGNLTVDSLDFSMIDSENVEYSKFQVFVSGSLSNIRQDYLDYSGRLLKYSYNRFTSNLLTDNNVIALFPFNYQEYFNSSGDYSFYLTKSRNLIGNLENNILKIIEISPSRKEVKISCIEEKNIQFLQFCNSTYPVKYWISHFNNFFKTYNFFSYVDPLIGTKDFEDFKLNFNIKNDAQVLELLYRIFVGSPTESIVSIKEQCQNYLYQIYEDYHIPIKDIQSKLFDISRDSTTTYLQNISFTSATEKRIEFANSIFKNIIEDVISYSEKYLEKETFFPLRTVFYIGKNKYYIINKKFNPEDYTLYLKFSNPLSDDVLEGNVGYVSNINFGVSKLIKMKNFFGGITKTQLKRLNPPTFLSKKINDYSPTIEPLPYNYSKEENSYFYKDNPLSIDFRELKNFIKFSSAVSRLNIYKNKKNRLVELDQYIVDESDPVEITKFIDLKDEIYQSFDGYEWFLYKNPEYFSIHFELNNENSQLESGEKSVAQRYDEDNKDSLYNNTPEIIRGDSQNEDYINFLNMIGHMFDNIWIYIEKFPTSNPYVGRTVPQESIKDVLFDLGIRVDYPESTFSLNSSLTESKERIKYEIWNRILESSSEILKRKGTKECLEIIKSCFDVPNDFLIFREFNFLDSKQKIFSRKYSLKFNGENEYIKTYWPTGSLSVQFKFNYHESPTQRIQYLAQCEDCWSIGTSKEKKDRGEIFFSIQDMSGSVKTSFIKDLPIYNGYQYSILLKKFDIDNVRSVYYLTAISSDEDRVVFKKTAQIMLSGSFNQNFSSNGKYLYLGNLDNHNGFKGTLDEIIISDIKVSDENFEYYSKTFNSLPIENSIEEYKNILTYINFEYPENVYSTSSIFTTKNKIISPRSLLKNVDLINFGEISSSNYQFDTFEKNIIKQISPLYGISLGTNEISINNSKENSPESSKVGVYYSPSDEVNKKCIDSLSSIKIDNIIGNNIDIQKNTDFKKIKEEIIRINSSNLKNVNYEINAVKNIINPSVFSIIENLIPERNSKVVGLLVENTVLDRNTIKTPEISANGLNQTKILNPNTKINSKNIPTKNGRIFVNNDGEFKENRTNAKIFSNLSDYDLFSFGYANSLCPDGGYAYVNQQDGILFVRDYITPLENRSIVNSSSFYYYNQTIEFIPIRPTDNMTLNGTISGELVGTAEELDYVGEFHINGKIKDPVLSIGNSFNKNVCTGELYVSGVYIGIMSGSFITHEINSFVGTIKTTDGEDIYSFFKKNLSGEDRDDIISGEKKEKFKKLVPNGKLFVGYRKLEKIKNKVTVNTSEITINEFGDSDGSPPIQSYVVDRGSIGVFEQGSGKILGNK